MTDTMEFKTTTQSMYDKPKPPEGDGWMLGGSAALPQLTAVRISPTPSVFMYWQRPKPKNVRVCAGCKAVAFSADGRCIGCREQHKG